MKCNDPKLTTHNIHDDGQDEEEQETLSLRDLPITTTTATATPTDQHRQSSDSFEFLTTETTSSVHDVILNGHILPFATAPRRSFSLSSAVTRSESTSNSAAARSMRPSRSLNSRKMRAKNEEVSLLHPRISSKRNSSCRRHCRSNDTETVKLPWYNWLIFGLPVKIPAEIELKDMKNRQSRRNTSTPRFFPGDRRSVGVNSSSASWKFVSVLSCKSHTSVDVLNTPPILR